MQQRRQRETWGTLVRGTRDTRNGHGTGQRGDANGKGEYKDASMGMGSKDRAVTNGTRRESDGMNRIHQGGGDWSEGGTKECERE